MIRRVIAAVGIAAALAAGPRAGAQVDPTATWRVLRTAHFDVYFTPELEAVARRAAGSAERAYGELASDLHPPRGRVHLVIADNADYSNGYASVSPLNRIVVYAVPPVNVSSLRIYGDWEDLVVTHELTHIFQNDRVRGWWRGAQYVFGRSPYLFPELYTPNWVQEGLAVYNESRLTGFGRLNGTEQGMVTRALVAADRLPAVRDVSASNPRFPYARSTYVFGATLTAQLAAARGAAGTRAFVDAVAAAPVPFFLMGHSARTSFGVSLTDAWRSFQDSVRRANPLMPLSTAWTTLSAGQRDVSVPRWFGPDTLAFAATPDRESPGLYAVAGASAATRLGRRNTLDANVRMPDGAILFAQLEYLDPYTVRSDLFLQRGGDQHRLTRGQRLSDPDARADGAIIAVQAVPGTTRLVRVSPYGRTVTPITRVAADAEWTEPRWSPEGARIAAVRHTADGQAEIVVVDTAGSVLAVVSRSRDAEAGPTWSPDGGSVLFSSDRDGTPAIYRAPATSPGWRPQTPVRIANALSGVTSVAVAPGGGRLSGVLLSADGYRVATTQVAAQVAPALATAPPPAVQATHGAATPIETPSRPYRAWSSLLPRYWVPTGSTASNGATWIGALTTAEDVVERHAYTAELEMNTRDHALDGSFDYEYRGFGNPLVDVTLRHSSSYGGLYSAPGPAQQRVGFLAQRSQIGTLSATFRRRRYRASGSTGLGVQVERRTFDTDPDSLLAGFAAQDVVPRTFASLIGTATWSNTQRPPLSISPEDGLSLSGSLRERWPTFGQRAGATVATLVGRAYKSIDAPGFAHHVLAWRVAGGYATARGNARFGAGGVSGSPFELLPGYSIGDVPRSYGVRGYPSAVRTGRDVVATALEYRAPLWVLGHGTPILPIFLDRVAATVFGEGACAWTPERPAERSACGLTGGADSRWLASVGAELNLFADIQYDMPYLLRIGLARPLLDRVGTNARAVTAYATLGLSF